MPVVAGSRVTLANIVFPEQANHEGTLFGGEALALMDKAAFVAASRYARRRVVTARSDGCDFRAPVRVGHLVEATAEVVATGRTSVSVEVKLVAEDLLSAERWLATHGRFVLVALDEQGVPVPIVPRGNDAPKECSQQRASAELPRSVRRSPGGLDHTELEFTVGQPGDSCSPPREAGSDCPRGAEPREAPKHPDSGRSK